MADRKRGPRDEASAAGKVLTFRLGGPCNNRCTFCRPGDLKARSLEDLYDEVAGCAARCVIIDGPGEPTIREDFLRLIPTVRRAGAVRVVLVTNGRMLAHAETAERLASQKPDMLVLSLHSTRLDEHESVTRTPHSFAQALTGLKAFLERRSSTLSRVFLRFVPLDGNLDRLPALCALSRGEGLDGVIVDPPGSGREGARAGSPAESLEGLERGVMTRRAFEDLAAADLPPPGDREGAAPPRFREDEGALSIVIRTGCKNACIFCTTRIIQEENAAPWPRDDLEVFTGPLRHYRSLGASKLRMVAVEPLEHPRVERLIAEAAAAGYARVEAWTSARALAAPGRAAELRRAGLTDLDVPLMGSGARVHDAVTRSRGSFRETVSGLRRAMAAGIRCKAHIIITRQNLHDLSGMLALGTELGLGPPASVLIPAPSSHDLALYRAFMPSYSDVMAALGRMPEEEARQLLARGLLNNIPACVVMAASRGYEDLLQTQRPVRQDWIQDGDLSEPGARLKLRTPCPRADRCGLARICVGYHEPYVSLFGSDELRPMDSRTGAAGRRSRRRP
jgi:MoaA/NifB/PqqE/SkfB family radical SAM enzyme